jgi:putative multiple sugar transport system permease protein
VLNNGLSLLGVSADVTQIIKGLVLLAAVAFDVFNKMQGRPSIIGHLTRNAGSRTPTSTAQTGATARPKA